MSDERIKRIVIVGAGVIGLTTAVKLQEMEGYEATIIAESLPTDPRTVKYTSYWAPRPGGYKEAQYVAKLISRPSSNVPTVIEIDRDTFDVMWKLSEPGSPTEHLFLRLEQEEHYYVEQPRPNGLAHMPNARPIQHITCLTNHSLAVPLPSKGVLRPISSGRSGLRYRNIDPPRYVNYLFARFLSFGGQVERASIQHINQIVEGGVKVFSTPKDASREDFDAIVVCAGLGARTLGGVQDKAVHPIRGQTVLLRAPCVRTGRTLSRDNLWTYIIPRRSGDVCSELSGTFALESISDMSSLAGLWAQTTDTLFSLNPLNKSGHPLPRGYPKPRPETMIDILTRALAIYSEFAPPEVRSLRTPTIDDIKPIVIDEGCGFRPGRAGGLRLEVEWFEGKSKGGKVPVVYNYGHAGSGFLSSWGSAAAVEELLQEALASGL